MAKAVKFPMLYIIEVGESSEQMERYVAPVAEADEEYLRRAVQHFVPLNLEQITQGLSVIFQSALNTATLSMKMSCWSVLNGNLDF